ncbi:MAG: tetratricopeptide repeat protein [Lentimicrobiaceae bacterium]|nr:tetratricopeptide repeat protein [Lentimicrobiaceae bacterium]
MKIIKHILNKVFVALFISFVAFTSAKAQSPEELFNRANALYNESAYDSAATIYKEIINSGYSSASLYYNLGNTYYKLRNYPLAILYYEKSIKLDPNNEDAQHNINIANSFISDKIEKVPELFIKQWWRQLGNLFSTDTWAVVSLIAFGILLVLLFLYLTARTRILKKSMFFSTIIMIIIVICSFSITINKYKYLKSHDEGIIITSTITVKSSPSSSSVDLFVLHEGSKVVILDNTEEWDKIKIANGSVGWLPSSSIIRY